MSDEHYMLNLDDPLNQERQDITFSDSPESWESQLQLRANELIRQRTNQLRSDLEQMQATINEISERIFDGFLAVPSTQETSGLLDCVRQWLNDSASKAEERFNSRLAEARAEASAEARRMAEAEFQELLKQAARDWDNAQKRANEIELGKRLEEARAQVTQELEQEFVQRLSEHNSGQLSSQMLDDAEIQQRLAQACAEAAAVARRESEAQIEELREQLEASRKALTLAVSTSNSSATDAGGIDLVKSAIVEIDQQRSQSETLATLVKRASDFAPRLVFFVIRGGEAMGWRAKGFDNGLADDTVRQLTVPTQNPGLLHDALAQLSTAVWRSATPGDGSTVLGSYGAPAPEYSIAIPLVVRGKAAAVLYADSGNHAENSLNTSAIETLMRVAGMAVELLPARRGSAEPARPSVQVPTSSAATAPMSPRPAPPAATGSTTPISPVTAPVSPLTAPAQATAPVATPTLGPQESGLFKTPGQTAAQPQPRTEPAKPLEKEIEQAKRVAQLVEAQPFVKPEWAVRVRTTEELIKPRQLPESWAEPDDQRRPGPAAEPFPGRSDSGRDSGSIRSGLSAKTEETKKTAEEGLSAFSQSSNQDSAPRQQPPVFSSVPTPASETEQRAHNDARRFARLLVSEIKLYNASKVNDGRRNFDLYDRLKDEIDRSRKVYDKRVVPSVASRFDYFYDELVQTLAEGDPAKLGPNSPGPVVLTT